MGAEEGNGLSVQSLAQRLETQDHRLEKLERENADLREEVAALRGSATRQAVGPAAEESEPFESEEGRVSRRWLLSKAGAAAAGLVAAGALTQRDIREAQAAPNRWTTDTSERGAVEGYNRNGNGYGVWGQSDVGVKGTSSANGMNGIGVKGIGKIGVHGEANEPGWAAVYGKNSTDFGYGVVGDGSGSGAGVLGRGATGVSGSSRFGLGVKGELTEGEGVGVFAKSSTDKGLAGWFEGGRAQLRIKPKGSAGKPTKTPHSQGDLYMDSEAQLFVCTVAGTPGTWRRFQTVAT